MLDNNLGIEPEEISDCHIYKRNSDIYIFGSSYIQLTIHNSVPRIFSSMITNTFAS